jgi:hypothetical protein
VGYNDSYFTAKDTINEELAEIEAVLKDTAGGFDNCPYFITQIRAAIGLIREALDGLELKKPKTKRRKGNGVNTRTV